MVSLRVILNAKILEFPFGRENFVVFSQLVLETSGETELKK